MRRWAGRLGRGIVWLAIGLLALGALGLFVPAIPFFGILGAALLAPFGPWIPLILAFVAFWQIPRGIARRSRAVIALGMFAAVGALGYGAALWRIAAAAREAGTRIDVAQTFTLRDRPGVAGRARSMVYGRFRNTDQTLLVYPTRAHSEPLPILVYVHGGGWVSGDAGMRAGAMRHFATQGVLPISASYALSSDTLHLADRTEDELGCALTWIRANAARLGGDPRRIALVGESAGGNLVLDLAYRANAGRLRSACGGTLPRIAAVLAAYPVVDPASFHDNPDPVLGNFAHSMAARYTGGTPTQNPKRYRAITSSTWIDPSAPPTLLLIPMQDHLVPNAATYAFARRASSAGVSVRVVSVPYSDHAFDISPGSIGNQLFLATTTALLQRMVPTAAH